MLLGARWGKLAFVRAVMRILPRGGAISARDDGVPPADILPWQRDSDVPHADAPMRRRVSTGGRLMTGFMGSRGRLRTQVLTFDMAVLPFDWRITPSWLAR